MGVDSDVAEENKRCREGDPEMAAVVCRDLYKTYGSFNANDGLCVSMQSNQIFALLGHNGAGKTTAIYMLTGMLKTTSGEAVVYRNNITTEIQ